jgi:lipid II:glycine glycyltransferase (peptidoglycan interpeptide bridge formation enzyme)
VPAPALELVRDRAEVNLEWDRALATIAGAHHVQSSAWARVKATARWRATRIVVYREDEIVGGCQLLWRELGKVVRVAYVPRGPVVRRGDVEALDALFAELGGEARALRLTYLKLQPPVDRHDVAVSLERRGFGRSALEVGPAASVRIDLGPSEAELLAAMHSRVRRNLRQSDREGLTVRVGERGDLATFVEIIDHTAQRQGFENYPQEYWTKVWDEFAPGGHTRLLITEHDGRPQSAILLIGFGDTVIYKMGGWTGERTKARPNESMHWAAIRWAREAGYRYYDLEGIEPWIARAVLAGEEPEIGGVESFKLSLGGDVVLYPGTYDALYRPVRARVARWAGTHGSGHPVVRKVVGRVS